MNNANRAAAEVACDRCNSTGLVALSDCDADIDCPECEDERRAAELACEEEDDVDPIAERAATLRVSRAEVVDSIHAAVESILGVKRGKVA